MKAASGIRGAAHLLARLRRDPARRADAGHGRLRDRQLIRERERSRDTPIIFLTALSRSETNVFRGYELGAVDYLFKPFDPEILRSKVNVFVELFRRAKRSSIRLTSCAALSARTS